ncbi:MAG: hypothetical protein HS108_13270 [Planctomycetes bacterium]|jgi:hypothetical protein|nr:hypothetical protein [Planctomycetota bacterium]MCL4730576.1 hypothetical protein [Planctomycetota bacterium]
MKPARLSPALWLLNAALLAGGALLLWMIAAEAHRDRQRALPPAQAMSRVHWTAAVANLAPALPEPVLSLRARPAPTKDAPPVRPASPEPTDEELRAELQAELNHRYALHRTITGVGDGETPGAFVLCAGTRLFVFEGMNLNNLQGREAAGRADVQVLAVGTDHILVNAPSPRRPDKRFDVRLEFAPASVSRPER